MKFTLEEDNFLRENYLKIPAKRMSRMLGRSESGARQRMKVLGLVVPMEIIKVFTKKSQFQKGLIPANKGKKQIEYMSAESIERTKATRFKKGQPPHNTKYDGAQRFTKDGYIMERVCLGKYRLKHRVEWEKVNGKIPKNMILWCKSNDLTNCNPSNWELITRKENMNRNSAVINLPDKAIATYLSKKSHQVDKELRSEILNHPELIAAKRNQILLNRKIKNYGTK